MPKLHTLTLYCTCGAEAQLGFGGEVEPQEKQRVCRLWMEQHTEKAEALARFDRGAPRAHAFCDQATARRRQPYQVALPLDFDTPRLL